MKRRGFSGGGGGGAGDPGRPPKQGPEITISVKDTLTGKVKKVVVGEVPNLAKGKLTMLSLKVEKAVRDYLAKQLVPEPAPRLKLRPKTSHAQRCEPQRAGAARMGPLLLRAMAAETGTATAFVLPRLTLASRAMESIPAASVPLPITLSIPGETPQPGERWRSYKQRVADRLGELAIRLGREIGLHCTLLHAANALRCRATPEQVKAAMEITGLRIIELDPTVRVIALDDAGRDLDLPRFRAGHPHLTGAGVKVAVLDSGIDTQHPYLRVAAAVSTCGEPVGTPGLHGTHVAGCLASRDSVYGGVAPEVDLLDIKVVDSQGRGDSSGISRGFDAALDQDADVISLSIGFNHLPTWSQGGHGWYCPDGKCPLCTAVTNAVLLENVPVVVAAGNDHAHAEFLRANGGALDFDTELSCPGQATGSITVGAVTKQQFVTAGFSSRGPTSFGSAKPDIATDGVNVTSCSLVPRDSAGRPLPGPFERGDITTRLSGTSMATPIVAGAVALLAQKRKDEGLPRDAAAIRKILLTQCFRPLSAGSSEVGVGRLELAGI